MALNVFAASSRWIIQLQIFNVLRSLRIEKEFLMETIALVEIHVITESVKQNINKILKRLRRGEAIFKLSNDFEAKT